MRDNTNAGWDLTPEPDEPFTPYPMNRAERRECKRNHRTWGRKTLPDGTTMCECGNVLPTPTPEQP